MHIKIFFSKTRIFCGINIILVTAGFLTKLNYLCINKILKNLYNSSIYKLTNNMYKTINNSFIII